MRVSTARAIVRRSASVLDAARVVSGLLLVGLLSSTRVEAATAGETAHPSELSRWPSTSSRLSFRVGRSESRQDFRPIPGRAEALGELRYPKTELRWNTSTQYSVLGTADVSGADVPWEALHAAASQAKNTATEPRVASSYYPSRQRIGINSAPQTPHPSVVRISAAEPGAMSHGSGTLVGVRGEYGLVVTNWHVIREARGSIVVAFPGGFRSAAAVAKVDEDWDLAALLIWRPDAAPVPISRRTPRPGDSLTIAGYGAGDFRAATGRCTQYVAPGMNMPYEMVEVSAQARQGDSGGPIFNDQGELAGVLFGAAGGTTSGSYCGRVRYFVESVWPAIDHIDKPSGEVMVSVPAPRDQARWQGAPRSTTPSSPECTQPLFERQPDRGVSRIPVTIDHLNRPANEKMRIDWKAILGSTPTDQAKSILAGIGILAVFLQFTRLMSGRRTGS